MYVCLYHFMYVCGVYQNSFLGADELGSVGAE